MNGPGACKMPPNRDASPQHTHTHTHTHRQAVDLRNPSFYCWPVARAWTRYGIDVIAAQVGPNEMGVSSALTLLGALLPPTE